MASSEDRAWHTGGAVSLHHPDLSPPTSRMMKKETEARRGKPCPGHPSLNLQPTFGPQAAPPHAKHQAGL